MVRGGAGPEIEQTHEVIPGKGLENFLKYAL